jgi:protein-tyrosine phosphatase
MILSGGSDPGSPLDQEMPLHPMPFGGWDPLAIRPHFGTYRGFVRLVLAHVEHRTGGLRNYQRVRWEAVTRVVFVCRGNICRSAYAERRAASCGLPAASFGIAAQAGAAADPSARRVAAMRGVDLALHRSCSVDNFEVRRGDLLIAMEPRQGRVMLRRFAAAPCQFTLLGLWSRTKRPHIHDPHRLNERYLTRCFDIIDSAVETIARQLRRTKRDGG